MKRFLALFLCSVVSAYAQWQSTEWNSGVNLKPLQGGEFSFVFPTSGHVNLIQRNQRVKLKQTVTVTYCIKTLSGKPKFVSLDPAEGLNPNFRPMLFTGDWYDENGRWWPTGTNCAFLTADGQTHVYSIKIIPKLWSNVFGKQNSSAFKSRLKKVNQLHLAFGGGRSFSHGVRVSNGTARFELIKCVVK